MESVINHSTVKFSDDSNKFITGKEGFKRSADHLPEAGDKKRILGDITNQAVTQNVKTRRATKTLKNSSQNSESGNNLVSKEQPPKLESVDASYVTCNSAFGDSLDSSHVKENETKPNIFLLQDCIPPGVVNFDETCRNDPYSESYYAADIFKYYREREKLFRVKKYLDKQKELNKSMRTVLVDWMVEIQESFEFNHETLYLAVKLVDCYLMHHFVPKAHLQLIGATAVFVAAKYDERQPPQVDDFLYICDDSYTREQLMSTEIKLLQTINYDLGIPLSYRFLRRYARCDRIPMDLLTLARYILEMALMDYEMIEELDSKMAAAALLLALKMKGREWTPTLQYFSGYSESDLNDLLVPLNKNISGPHNKHVQTIRTKYSHRIFHEVAKIPPLNLSKLTK